MPEKITGVKNQLCEPALSLQTIASNMQYAY